jgi:hypothetical protein
MGNSSSKNADAPAPSRPDGSGGPNAPDSQYPSTSARSRNRASRADFSLLTGFNPPRASASQQTTVPEQRRETRQEREARRLEKDRVAREKERERSMREEHVDGGFLVTMGIYRGREDFSKPVVRQLQVSAFVERDVKGACYRVYRTRTPSHLIACFADIEPVR